MSNIYNGSNNIDFVMGNASISSSVMSTDVNIQAINSSNKLIELWTGFVANLIEEDIVEITQNGAFMETFDMRVGGSKPNLVINGFRSARPTILRRSDVTAAIAGVGISAAPFHDPTPVRTPDAVNDTGTSSEVIVKLQEGFNNDSGFAANGGVQITINRNLVIQESVDMIGLESTADYAQVVAKRLKLFSREVFNMRAFNHWSNVAAYAQNRYVADGATNGYTMLDSYSDGSFAETPGNPVEQAYDNIGQAIVTLKGLINLFHVGIPQDNLYIAATPEFGFRLRKYLKNNDLAGVIFAEGTGAIASINGVKFYEDQRIAHDSGTITNGAYQLADTSVVDFVVGVRGSIHTPLTWNKSFVNPVTDTVSVFRIGQEFSYGTGILDDGLHIVGINSTLATGLTAWLAAPTTDANNPIKLGATTVGASGVLATSDNVTSTINSDITVDKTSAKVKNKMK